MRLRSIFPRKARNRISALQSQGFRNSQKSPPGDQPGTAILSAQAMRYLDRLALQTRSLRFGEPVGSRSSQARRPASEFLEHRQYAPGDDIRHVDWKASARQDHIFIKQGEELKAVMVYLLLDCSASMAWGSPPKSEAALRLASALSYLALAHDDRLVISPVAGDQTGRSFHPLGPLWGKGQAPLVNSYLRSIRFEGQVDLDRALAGLARRNGSSGKKNARGGLVLVISDLLGTTDLADSLDALPVPGWNVAICHLLHPQEISPELDGYFEMVDVETGEKKRYPVTPRVLETYRRRLQSWQAELAEVCREKKAVYTSLPSHWSLEQEMIPQLLRDQVVKRRSGSSGL